MKAKKMMVMAVMAASALAFGGESFARGGGAGTGGGVGQGIQAQTQSMNRSAVSARQGVQMRTQSMNQTMPRSATQVRPEGSQRRDGTFQSTGTRANGSTVRPGNGRGLMDGTGINHPAPTAPTGATP